MNSLFQLSIGMRFSCGDEQDSTTTFVITEITKESMWIQNETTNKTYPIPNELTINCRVEPIFENQLP